MKNQQRRKMDPSGKHEKEILSPSEASEEAKQEIFSREDEHPKYETVPMQQSVAASLPDDPCAVAPPSLHRSLRRHNAEAYVRPGAVAVSGTRLPPGYDLPISIRSPGAEEDLQQEESTAVVPSDDEESPPVAMLSAMPVDEEAEAERERKLLQQSERLKEIERERLQERKNLQKMESQLRRHLSGENKNDRKSRNVTGSGDVGRSGIESRLWCFQSRFRTACILMVFLAVGAIVAVSIVLSGGDDGSDHSEATSPAPSPTAPPFVTNENATVIKSWEPLGQSLTGEGSLDYFGWSVALSADGTILAAGAYWNDGSGYVNSGHVRVFMYEDGQFQQLGADVDGEASYDQFGGAVALSADGKILAAGAIANDAGSEMPDTGHVRVLRFNSDTQEWSQIGAAIKGVEAVERFGYSLALSQDGFILAAGSQPESSNSTGYVRVFRYSGLVDQWSQIGQRINGASPGDKFGQSVSVSADGTIVAIGAPENDARGPNSGCVRVFQYNRLSNEWRQLGQVLEGRTADDMLGISVALSADGGILAAGASERTGLIEDDSKARPGYVRVFGYFRLTNQWNMVGKDLMGEASGDQFGHSVALSADGSILAVGAHRSDGSYGSTRSSGQVRIFGYDSVTIQWNQLGSALDGEKAYDDFGISVALSDNGSIVAAGAWLSDGDGADEGQVRVFAAKIEEAGRKQKLY